MIVDEYFEEVRFDGTGSPEIKLNRACCKKSKFLPKKGSKGIERDLLCTHLLRIPSAHAVVGRKKKTKTKKTMNNKKPKKTEYENNNCALSLERARGGAGGVDAIFVVYIVLFITCAHEKTAIVRRIHYYGARTYFV